jgi:hypothetical protein
MNVRLIYNEQTKKKIMKGIDRHTYMQKSFHSELKHGFLEFQSQYQQSAFSQKTLDIAGKQKLNGKCLSMCNYFNFFYYRRHF